MDTINYEILRGTFGALLGYIHNILVVCVKLLRKGNIMSSGNLDDDHLHLYGVHDWLELCKKSIFGGSFYVPFHYISSFSGKHPFIASQELMDEETANSKNWFVDLLVNNLIWVG